MIKKQTHLENVLKVKMFLEPDPIKNSGVDSYSLLESTYQIIQETNFGFSDWTIPALSQILLWNFYRIESWKSILW